MLEERGGNGEGREGRGERGSSGARRGNGEKGERGGTRWRGRDGRGGFCFVFVLVEGVKGGCWNINAERHRCVAESWRDGVFARMARKAYQMLRRRSHGTAFAPYYRVAGADSFKLPVFPRKPRQGSLLPGGAFFF